MAQYVAFLRAVNVGRRRVEMARLKRALEDLGHQDVWTYINSGNAVFSSAQKAGSLVGPIEARLAEVFGFEIPTLLRTAAQVKGLAGQRPFGDVGPDRSHMVVLMRQKLTPAEAKAVEALSSDKDRLVVDGTEVHWFIGGKTMDSGLKAKDWKALGDQPSTVRNHTMIVKLAAKL